MDKMWDLIKDVEIPKMIHIRQHFDPSYIDDIEKNVREALCTPGTADRILPGQSISIAVGSRGIARIPDIVKTIVEEVKARGAHPFIVPAMGSHGGATGEGQRQVLRDLGVTEEYVGCEIRSSMEVYEIGEFYLEETGNPVKVYFDKNAMNADGVIPIARVKPHTCFRAPIESGICKMLTIGLGKQKGANECHRHGFKYMYEMLVKAGKMKIDTGKILFAIATVENAYDQPCRIEAVPADAILERDEALQTYAKSRMGRLLIDPVDVLVLRRFGKDISGDGFDPNVLGKPMSNITGVPRVHFVGVLDLTDATHGNASGIGNVEVITRRALNKIDTRATYANAITTLGLDIAKIPLVMDSDREAIMTLVGASGALRDQDARVVIATDSMHISDIYISEAMLDDARQAPNVEIIGDPFNLPFSEDGTLLLPL